MRRVLLVLFAVALVVSACGDDGGSDEGTSADTADSGSDAASAPSGLASEDVCALLSDDEMTSLVGEALPAEPLGADSPFIGCSWNTGSVLVQVDVGADTPVTAPGQECTSVDLGDEALDCGDGSVQFITNGMRVRVSTDGFPLDVGGDAPDVLVIATALEPKFAALG